MQSNFFQKQNSAAKEEIAFVEGRIKEIEELMKNAEVVDTGSSDSIEIGTEVVVEKNGTEERFSIVGEFEADPISKKLSATSPIGKALLGKKTGSVGRDFFFFFFFFVFRSR